MSMKINKNGKEYPVGVIPKNYPASNIVKANGVNLEDATTWKSLAGITDNSEHDLPTASEYLFIAEYGVFKILFSVPEMDIPSSYSYYLLSGNSVINGAIRLKTGKVIFDQVIYNGANKVGDGAKLTVYYR